MQNRPLSLPRPLAGVALACLLSLLAAVPAARAQGAVFHYCIMSWEDGDPRHDSDGTKDGVLTLGGGKTHVVKNCNVYGTERLVIEPGAIVKVASDCKFDADYKVESCKPVPFCCNQNFWAYGPESAIQIDGATITDVRDHTEGATITIEPYPGAPTTPVPAWDLLFNRSGDNYITNSTLKYAAQMLHVGDMRITGNRFLAFGGIKVEPSQALVNTSPVITDNLFELAYPSNGGGRIDLRGKAALFSGNTVKSLLVETPSTPAGSNVSTIGLVIGPFGENMGYPDDPLYPWGPRNGQTIVTGNTFETATGVEMERGTQVVETSRGYERVNFRATISNNTFRGTNNPAKGTPGGTAIYLVMDAEVVVSSNEVSNYATPFTAYQGQTLTRSRLRITGNRFSLEGTNANGPVYGGRYDRGLFVNAEHNYWGDPSGPLDRSKADGLHNPRGKGVVVGDGIDYVPFVGGQAVYADDVHIVVQATRWFEDDFGDLATESAAEFAAGDSIEFVVSADLIRLRTADTGTLVVHVLDHKGDRVFSSAPVAITAGDARKEIPAFGLHIPGNGAYVDVQAEIIPGDADEGEPSNAQRFRVKGARSRFTFQAVDPAKKGSLDAAVQGATSSALLQLFYTLSTAGGNGTFEFSAEERRRGTNVVLNRFGAAPLSVPPGKDLQAEQKIDFTFALPSVPTKTEFFIRILLKDDQGQVVAGDSASVNIRSPGIVRFGNHSDEDEADDDTPSVAPATVSGGSLVRAGRSYFSPGDDLTARAGLTYRINTPGATGWQLHIDRIEGYTAAGALIERYTAAGALGSLSTTVDRQDKPDEEFGTVDVVAAGKKVPPGAARLRFVARLTDGSGKLMAHDSTDVEVRAPAQTETVNVPANAQKATFAQVQAELTFTTNTQGGTVTAERFAGPFDPGRRPPYAAAGKVGDYSAWDLVPLNRYWSLFGTLQEGTFQARATFTYDPALDFPAAGGFNADSLVVAAFNPLSGALEVLPSTLDQAAHTLSADYSTFFETYVVAARRTVVVPTANEAVAEVPEQYALEPNYPNPFNPATTFVFRMPTAGAVTIRVYNVLGQVVQTLVEGTVTAGVHRVQWDGRAGGGEAASGVYLVRMQAGRFSQVRTALLVR